MSSRVSSQNKNQQQQQETKAVKEGDRSGLLSLHFEKSLSDREGLGAGVWLLPIVNTHGKEAEGDECPSSAALDVWIPT